MEYKKNKNKQGRRPFACVCVIRVIDFKFVLQWFYAFHLLK